MGKLYFLIGLPRSGKSTLARKWAKCQIEIKSGGRITDYSDYFVSGRVIPENPRVVVCGDDIRLALGHRYNYFVEDFVCTTKYTMVRALLRNHDVLLDETNTTEQSISALLKIDPKAKCYFVNTPIETCIQRAKDTRQDDLVPIIEKMSQNLTDLAMSFLHSSDSYKGRIYSTIDCLRKDAKFHKENYQVINER